MNSRLRPESTYSHWQDTAIFGNSFSEGLTFELLTQSGKCELKDLLKQNYLVVRCQKTDRKLDNEQRTIREKSRNVCTAWNWQSGSNGGRFTNLYGRRTNLSCMDSHRDRTHGLRLRRCEIWIVFERARARRCTPAIDKFQFFPSTWDRPYWIWNRCQHRISRSTSSIHCSHRLQPIQDGVWIDFCNLGCTAARTVWHGDDHLSD